MSDKSSCTNCGEPNCPWAKHDPEWPCQAWYPKPCHDKAILPDHKAGENYRPLESV